VARYQVPGHTGGYVLKVVDVVAVEDVREPVGAGAVLNITRWAGVLLAQALFPGHFAYVFGDEFCGPFDFHRSSMFVAASGIVRVM
jgi:hypothetical protein